MKKWISGYEGLYEISTDGAVYRHYKSGAVKQLSPRQNGSGYLIVALSRNAEVKTCVVHRLVAEAFIPNTENLPMVDHIDEDKTNNTVNNLRWCDAKSNAEYYNTKDGRAHHIELGRKRKKKLKEYEHLLAMKVKEITALKKEVALQQKILDKKEEVIRALLVDLETARQALALEAKLLSEETDRKYAGYINTSGIKFNSVDDMVALTGKPITVDNCLFNSCKAAAKYIAQKEAEYGRIRKEATISKELRRYLQGLRPSWKMYGKYNIK